MEQEKLFWNLHFSANLNDECIKSGKIQINVKLHRKWDVFFWVFCFYLNFLLLKFLVKNSERRQFQNIFFCSIDYHICITLVKELLLMYVYWFQRKNTTNQLFAINSTSIWFAYIINRIRIVLLRDNFAGSDNNLFAGKTKTSVNRNGSIGIQ